MLGVDTSLESLFSFALVTMSDNPVIRLSPPGETYWDTKMFHSAWPEHCFILPNILARSVLELRGISTRALVGLGIIML